jgi:hypothetical protein
MELLMSKTAMNVNIPLITSTQKLIRLMFSLSNPMSGLS